MANEIIYVCNSKNNKNVRDGELKILRKVEDSLYFEFGDSEENIKKRFYDDEKTMNKDFSELLKLKEDTKSKKNVSYEKEEASAHFENEETDDDYKKSEEVVKYKTSMNKRNKRRLI